MIISQTPLRISFAGGGSDLPSYYLKHGGAVLSTSINKFVYVNVNPKFDNGIRVAYSRTEEVDGVDKVEHPLVKAALEMLEIKGGLELTTIADIPSKGTGLGSSSTFTVGLVNALNAYRGRFSSKDYLADAACEIEINRCGEPIGKQDQYAAAFGGLNFIEFSQNGRVHVSPVICKSSTTKTIESNLLLFYTGLTRSASSLLKKQSEGISQDEKKRSALMEMVKLTYQLKEELQNNRPHSLGEILHANWVLKKSLSEEISNPQIDEWYDRARKSGAMGGKLLGAGAGGFLLFYAEQAQHAGIVESLRELKNVPFQFDQFGSRIIFYDK